MQEMPELLLMSFLRAACEKFWQLDELLEDLENVVKEMRRIRKFLESLEASAMVQWCGFEGDVVHSQGGEIY